MALAGRRVTAQCTEATVIHTKRVQWRPLRCGAMRCGRCLSFQARLPTSLDRAQFDAQIVVFLCQDTGQRVSRLRWRVVKDCADTVRILAAGAGDSDHLVVILAPDVAASYGRGKLRKRWDLSARRRRKY